MIHLINEEFHNPFLSRLRATTATDADSAIKIVELVFRDALPFVDFQEAKPIISSNITPLLSVGTPETILIEMIKIGMIRHGRMLAKTMHTYGITDQATLIELATLLAKHNPHALCLHIQNFGITDQKDLIEIAKMIAEQDPQSAYLVSCHIQNFGITEEQSLLEIALIASSQNAYGVSSVIKKYGFRTELFLIEIAKHVASRDGWAISQWICKYGIQDPSALVEIALIAASQNGPDTLKRIKNYGTLEKKDLISIAQIGIHQNPCTFEHILSEKKITSEKEILSGLFLNALSADCNSLHMASTAVKKGLVFWPFTTFASLAENKEILPGSLYRHGQAFKPLINHVFSTQDPYVKKQLLTWLVHLLAYIQCTQLEPQGMEFILKHSLLTEIVNYQEPQFRYVLNGTLVTVASFAQDRDFYETTPFKSFSKLTMLFLSLLASQGVSISEKTFKVVNHRCFKDAQKLKILAKGLNALLLSPLLPADKSFLLHIAEDLPETQIVSFFSHLTTITSLKEFSFLTEEHLKANQNSLAKIMKSSFQKYVPVNAKPETFDLAYAKHFENARVPHYPLIYGAKTQHEGTHFSKQLAFVVQSIMDETFHDNRYHLSRSEHLTRIFGKRPALLEAWKLGESSLLIPFLTQAMSANVPMDFEEILKTNFQIEHHVNREEFPVLAEFLVGSLSLKQALKALKSSPCNPEQTLIQMRCLLLAKQTHANAQSCALLEKILEELQNIPSAKSFTHQISGVLKSLKKDLSKYAEWTLVDTDNPEDLFLSGTEIEGSCQSISGDSHYNKCLLAYVADGKNRLLAIKDGSQKIRGRAMIRILASEKEPVLFLEQFYPKTLQKTLCSALTLFARQRRAHLQEHIPEEPLYLLSSSGKHGKYPHPIESLGSPAPFEYVDAEDQGITEGEFTLSKAYHVEDPKILTP